MKTVILILVGILGLLLSLFLVLAGIGLFVLFSPKGWRSRPNNMSRQPPGRSSLPPDASTTRPMASTVSGRHTSAFRPLLCSSVAHYSSLLARADPSRCTSGRSNSRG